MGGLQRRSIIVNFGKKNIQQKTCWIITLCEIFISLLFEFE